MSTTIDPWAILGIERCDDFKRDRKAYAEKLEQTHPEQDPDDLAHSWHLNSEYVVITLGWVLLPLVTTLSILVHLQILLEPLDLPFAAIDDISTLD